LEIIDGGICAEIASFAENAWKLIIVDAIKGCKEPGTVYRLSVDDVMANSSSKLSLHHLNIPDSLKILRLIGKEPKDTVIGWGLDLSSGVQKGLAELKKMVIKEIGTVVDG
jgi:hydrogenase maturation protease